MFSHYVQRRPTIINIYEAPLPFIAFLIAMMVSISIFTLRANGIHQKSIAPSDIRLHKLALISFAMIIMGTVLVMWAAPSTYIQPAKNVTKTFSRRNCSNPVDIREDFYTMCPTFRQNYSVVHRADYIGNISEISSLTDQEIFELVVRAQEKAPFLSSFYAIERWSFLAILNEDCTDYFLDIVCETAFRRCTYGTCTTMDSCSAQHVGLQWIKCGKQHCEQSSICDAEDFTPSSFSSALDILRSQMYTLDTQVTKAEYSFVLETLKYIINTALHSTSAEFDEVCGKEWHDAHKIRKSDTSVTSSTSAIGVISCNPTQTTYQSKGTKERLNSTWMLLNINLLLFLVTVAFLLSSKAYRNSVLVCPSYARIACCCIAIIMSLLVFIGATELIVIAPKENDSRYFWCWLYYAVAAACWHGGLCVLVPAEKHNGCDNEETFPEMFDTSARTQRVRRQSMVVPPRVYACCTPHATVRRASTGIAAIKRHFLDAGGRWFPLKLAMLEIFECAMQFYSLMSSASSSDGQQVMISGVVMSLNLIALPLTTVVAGYVFKKSSAVVAATLTVELVFDKLFTGVAVLLRPDTITE